MRKLSALITGQGESSGVENEDPDEGDEFGFDEDDDDLPCLIDCDECGKVMEPGLFDGDDPLLTVLPDSSAIYENPENDGTRMVMLCSPKCFEKIQERFRQRSFVWEELWAGKMARSVMAHPDEVPPQRLEEETGLTPQQIRAGFAWLEQMRRRAGDAQRPGRPTGPDGGSSPP